MKDEYDVVRVTYEISHLGETFRLKVQARLIP